MSKKIMVMLLVVLAVALTLGIAGAKACPPSSHNPTGTPPNCGHAPPPPPPTPTPTPTPATCSTGGLGDGSGLPLLDPPGTVLNNTKDEKGRISDPVHKSVEPAVASLGPAVHEINCDVVVTLGL